MQKLPEDKFIRTYRPYSFSLNNIKMLKGNRLSLGDSLQFSIGRLTGKKLVNILTAE